MKKWLSKDPISEAGGVNLYGFVNNEPISRYDIFGLLDPCQIIIVCGHGSPSGKNGIQNTVNGFANKWKGNPKKGIPTVSPESARVAGVGCHDALATVMAGDYGFFDDNDTYAERWQWDMEDALEAKKEKARQKAPELCGNPPECCKSIAIRVIIDETTGDFFIDTWPYFSRKLKKNPNNHPNNPEIISCAGK